MAKKDKTKEVSDEPAAELQSPDLPGGKGKKDKKDKKEKKAKKGEARAAKTPAQENEDEDASTFEEVPVSKSSSKKRKAPVVDDDSDNANAPASPPSQGPAPKKQKPKQKKNPKQSEEDALFDLDLGINTIFARMDRDLLADYLAACTKRFGTDLSPIELSDLYLPVGAIKDTTTFSETRVKEKLPDFLEHCVAGESEVEQKRLGSAPKEKGAPHTIVVTGGGMRAADLVRAARKFQKKDSLVAKLVS